MSLATVSLIEKGTRIYTEHWKEKKNKKNNKRKQHLNSFWNVWYTLKNE